MCVCVLSTVIACLSILHIVYDTVCNYYLSLSLSLCLLTDIPDSVVTIRDDLVTLLVSKVSWDAPNANNDPIIEYSITVCDLTDNGCMNYTSDVANIVLFVVPKRNYNVSITSTNEVGSSEPSEMVIIEGAQPGELLYIVVYASDIIYASINR